MSTEANVLSVTVTQVPGRSQAVLVNDGATVGDALSEAGLSADGMQIRLGGQAVSTDRPVEAGDHIVLSRQIKGN